MIGGISYLDSEPLDAECNSCDDAKLMVVQSPVHYK